MQLVYQSDNYVVVQFQLPDGAAAADAPPHAPRGGYEIVDRFARREIFIEGALAERFQQEVQALVEKAADGDAAADALDAYIAGYVALAQQPVLLH